MKTKSKRTRNSVATRSSKSDRSHRSHKPQRSDRQDRSGTSGRTEKGGKIWLYGNHAVIAALANPERRKYRLLVTQEAAPNLERVYVHDKPDLVAEVMERADIDRLVPPGAVHQGMALLADPLDPVFIEDICAKAGKRAIVVVLDQPNDPRNIGAVLRSASAFGALAVVVPNRHAPEATAAVAKAASGALDRVPLVRAGNLAKALETLKNAGFWCAGLTADAPQALAETDWADRVALVIGAEGAGLRRLTADTCDFLVQIPIQPDTDSLNLSAAASIALYEVSRFWRSNA